MVKNPDFEVVLCEPHESFRWHVHCYPHPLAKWHHHPEYELHLIQDTRGQMRVGDYVGPFYPGNLVLTGPYLPHHWVSDLPPNTVSSQRDMVLQFSEHFASVISSCAEMANFKKLLHDSTRGLEFKGQTRAIATEILRAMGEASGLRRLGLFLELAEVLSGPGAERVVLSELAADQTESSNLDRVGKIIAEISLNFRDDLRLDDFAKRSNMEPSTFSRLFKKQTGYTFSAFVARVRIHHACRLLANSQLSVTQICFDSGFNNTANFNRQFMALCGDTPSGYRRAALTIAGARLVPHGPALSSPLEPQISI